MIRTMRLTMIAAVLLATFGIAFIASAQDCDLTNAGALTERARNKSDAGDYEGAIADFTCAIDLSPDDPDLFNERGIAYDDLGELTEALADYEKALELDPNYSYAYNNRANIYYQRGHYELAINDYTISLALDGENQYIPYYNRGNAYQETGAYELAVMDLTESIKLNDEYADAFISRAWTYLVMGDDGAHADFARWIELTQTDVTKETLEEALESAPLTLGAGVAYYLTFDGISGQILRASALTDAGSSVDPLLVLLDPSGTPVISDDDSGINLNAVISQYVFETTGEYTLILGQAGGNGTGNIDLNVELSGVALVASGDEEVGDFSTYNLFIDDTAEVFTTAGDRLNVREGPGLDFEIIERLDRGTYVTLLDGPRKADGYAWWRVETPSGMTGWAVERVEEEQTLQLALFANEDAIVTSGGEMLNVRVEPARSADLAFQIEDGTQVTITGEPVTADNFRWWPIQTTVGSGWIVDRIGLERMIIPARERPQG